MDQDTVKLYITSIQFYPEAEQCQECPDKPYFAGRATAWFDVELDNGERLENCSYPLQGDLKSTIVTALHDLEIDIQGMIEREISGEGI